MRSQCPQGYEDCPFLAEEHFNFCGHRRPLTHLHWPKKGMGGHNPKSKIVALACGFCHDRIDNFGGRIEIEDGQVKGLTRDGTVLFRHSYRGGEGDVAK